MLALPGERGARETAALQSQEMSDPGDRWPVLALRCRTCDVAVTGPLEEVVLARPALFEDDGAPTDPAEGGRGSPEPGTLWRARAGLGWGSPGDWVVHPDALRECQPCGDWSGCCGPTGGDGPNLACRSGHAIAIRVRDCWTPDLVVVLADRVRVTSEAVPLPGRPVVIGRAPIVARPALIAVLHAGLACAGWHGDDLDALLLDHATGPGEAVRIYWEHSRASADAGLDVAGTLGAFARARRRYASTAVLRTK